MTFSMFEIVTLPKPFPLPSTLYPKMSKDMEKSSSDESTKVGASEPDLRLASHFHRQTSNKTPRQYMERPKLWLIVASMTLAMFLTLLDTAIIGTVCFITAIPFPVPTK